MKRCAEAFFAVIVWASNNSVVAQIIPDSTLPNNSVVTPNGNTFDITGGTTDDGDNLFHSFSQFSLPTGTAFFNNNTDITNIISRVTGDSISNINGTIQTNGSANLFFINPNGIIFGPNARLEIGGSFVASTADRIVFSNGNFFSATNPGTPSLLTVNVPLGVQYGANPGSIQVQGSTLEVSNGKTLALLGGNVRMEGGTLSALGGRVELGGLAGAGTLGLLANGSVSFSADAARADVSLLNGAVVDVLADGGGNIDINGRNIELLGDTTRLTAGIVENAGAPNAKAGDIRLNATGATILQASRIENNVRRNATGEGGEIQFITGSVSLLNGAQIDSATFGRGNAGKITIRARDTISFDGVRSVGGTRFPSGIRSPVEQGAVGNAGDISIEAQSFFITNGGQIRAETAGQGNAGNIMINARDTVSFDGMEPVSNFSSIIFSRVRPGAVGRGGDITITTGKFSLTNGAQMISETRGTGNAGNITVIAQEDITLSGVGGRRPDSAAIISSVEQGGRGNGGNIRIEVEAGSMAIAKGAFVDAATNARGNAGNIRIRARDTVSIDGVNRNRTSTISSPVARTAVGNGGNISIDANSVFVTNGGQINVSSRGSGNAGSLTVDANSIVLDNQGKLIASTASGEGGNINLQVEDFILMRRNSLISAQASNNGNGGNITINTPFIVAVPKENSDIIANAFQGQGGNIDITAQGIYGLEYRPQLTPLSDINASSEFGVNGTVNINTPGVDPQQGLVQLPETLPDSSNQMAVGCAAARGNSFTVTGRGGLPEDPTGTIRGQTVWRDLQDFSEQEVVQAAPHNPQALIGKPSRRLVEANSWVRDEQGNVVLIAAAGNESSSTYKSRQPDCQDLSALESSNN